MSGLVVRDKNGEEIHYSGSRFEGLEDVGALHLHVRTGSGPDDVVKYALTSKPLDDKYKALRMRIPDGANGKEAYIAQRYVDVRTVTTEEEYTSTRSSEYTTTEREDIASTTSVGTTNATRQATFPVRYYGSAPIVYTTTYGLRQPVANRTTGISVRSSEDMKKALSRFYDLSFIPPIYDGIKSEASYSAFSVLDDFEYDTKGRYRNVTVAFTDYKSSGSEALYLPVYSITGTKTSSIEDYTTTTQVPVASKTSSHTITASRSSGYTSTRSAETTAEYITNNADL